MNYSKQRSIILDIMKKTYDHPTVEEVFEEAKKVYPKIGIATVYRNLNQLSEMGEIKKIALGNGNDRFDGQLEEHYHMVCTKCGRLQDLKAPPEKMSALRKQLIDAFGLKVSNQASLSSAVMEGVCDHCRKSNKAIQ